MNFNLCVLLVYNDNGFVQTLCTYRANARYSKCLHKPFVIINQQYTKGEIFFLYIYIDMCNDCVLSIEVFEIAALMLKLRRCAQ